MATIARPLMLASLLLLPLSLQAQDTRPAHDRPAHERPYASERHMIETALATVISIIQEVTLQNTGHAVGDHLRNMATQLGGATEKLVQMPPQAATPAVPLMPDDLERLRTILTNLQRDLAELRESLNAEGQADLADRLLPLDDGLAEAQRLVRNLEDDRRVAARADDDRYDDDNRHRADEDGWLRPGRYGDDEYYDDEDPEDRRTRAREEVREARRNAREIRREAQETAEEIREEIRDEWDSDDWWRDRRRDDHEHHDASFDHHTDASYWVGDLTNRWPYRESALYRPFPAIRYNRVEGLVLGVQRSKLEWDSWEKGRIYGQVGYAFALKDVRYEVGAETRLGGRYGSNNDLKIGGSYRHTTATNDLWKSSWAENSLAAFLFRTDFFDYYQTEGFTLYAVGRFGRHAQASVGYRSDEYISMGREATWSLFGGESFRFNPLIDEGLMQSIVVTLEGGQVRDLHRLPEGGAVRLEAEFGDGLGGDFAFNRYIGDARLYLPVSGSSSLSLRFRAGQATGDFVPYQKAFTLGGIGSVRAFSQNRYVGTHMLLGNIEYGLYHIGLLDGLFDDLLVSGFLDAGWVGDDGFDTFDMDDLIPSAGLGLGFADRTVRLELAWPLKDLEGTRQPALWLRINPAF